LVEVLPKIPKVEKEKLKIKNEDLKIEFFRASGPGGQYVNKKETAVRITHLPTGIVASCQTERSQARNKEKAMEMLYSRLYQMFEEKKEKELLKIKGKEVSPSWGNQIRSYVFQPYKLVKDLRTGVETKDVQSVLDGDLDKFIEAEIKLKC
jgi:peptide chain release factor 2